MKPTVPIAVFLVLIAHSQAALVTNWTERLGDTPVSGMNTASPTLGDGTSNSADAMSIYASMPTVTLTNVGDSVTLSASVTLSGIAGGANQFRWGLYDVNGSVNDTGWLGYFGSSGHSTSGAALNERASGNTGWYMTTGAGNAASIQTAAAPNVAFNDATYNILLTLERTASGIQIDSSIIRSSDSLQFGLHSIEDTTPLTYSFNRVGFLIGGTLDADQAQFSSIDVTFVPEPSASALGLVGASTLLLLRRKR
jgi:hypothetical protein